MSRPEQTGYSQLCIMILGKHSQPIAPDHFELEGGGGNADAEDARNVENIASLTPSLTPSHSFSP